MLPFQTSTTVLDDHDAPRELSQEEMAEVSGGAVYQGAWDVVHTVDQHVSAT